MSVLRVRYQPHPKRLTLSATWFSWCVQPGPFESVHRASKGLVQNSLRRSSRQQLVQPLQRQQIP